MAEERPAAAPERRFQTQIALLLAAAAVTTALIGARTAYLAGSAGGKWETGVRTQVKRDAAATQAELLVFGNSVPGVARYQEARIRAQEYLLQHIRQLGELTPAESEALLVLAQIESQREKAMSSVVAEERRYLDGDNYDLDRRLADQRERDLQGFDDVTEVREEGNDLSTRAVAEALAGLPAAFAILLGSLARVLRRGRRAALWGGGLAVASSWVAAIALEVVNVA
jgi:hypothetical protein